MRIYVACLMLLVAPAAVVIYYKDYFRPQMEQQITLPTKGEVLFFNATWCGPCREMKPIVKRLRRQGYHMRDIDIDSHRQLASQYGIHAVPTFVFLENGTEVNRFSGGTSAEHLRKLCADPAYR